MPEETAATPLSTKSPTNKLTSALIIALLILLAGVGYLGWQVSSLTSENAALTKQVADLTSPASSSAKPATSAATPATAAAAPATITISNSLKENMAAAISSKNTAALEGYMASSVNVVIAASGKTGAESPTQAVTDLDYVSAGTDPWNFNLSAATLTSFKNGFYGQYFGNGTYVGESANNYVISFGINSAGKIAVIFMAQNANLLN